MAVNREELQLILTANNRQLLAELREADRAVGNFTAKGSKGMAALRAGALAAAAGLATLGAGAIRARDQFAQYERQLAAVNTLTASNVAIGGDFDSALRRLSTTLGNAGGQAELAGALYQGLSAGVTEGAEAIEFLDIAAKTAIGGLTSTEVAVDALTSVINAYGLETRDATRIAEIFLATQNEGKTTVGQLAPVISRVTPLAASLGVSFERVGAAMAVLTASGTPTAEAATGLRNAMARLVNPTDEVAQAIEQLGFQSGESLVRARGLEGALQDVVNVIGTANVGAAFGLDAQTAVLTLTQRTRELEEANRAVVDSVGLVDQQYAKFSDTIAVDIDRTRNKWETFWSAAGAAVTVTSEPVIDLLAQIAGIDFTPVDGTMQSLRQNMVEAKEELMDVRTQLQWAIDHHGDPTLIASLTDEANEAQERVNELRASIEELAAQESALARAGRTGGGGESASFAAGVRAAADRREREAQRAAEERAAADAEAAEAVSEFTDMMVESIREQQRATVATRFGQLPTVRIGDTTQDTGILSQLQEFAFANRDIAGTQAFQQLQSTFQAQQRGARFASGTIAGAEAAAAALINGDVNINVSGNADPAAIEGAVLRAIQDARMGARTA